MEELPTTAETVLACVVGRLQGLAGTTRALTTDDMKGELRTLLNYIEERMTEATVGAMLAEVTPDIGDARRAGYLTFRVGELDRCREWKRDCAARGVPCITLRLNDSDFAPATVYFADSKPADDTVTGETWNRAIALFKQTALKEADGESAVVLGPRVVYGLLPTIAAAEALAAELVRLVPPAVGPEVRK